MDKATNVLEILEGIKILGVSGVKISKDGIGVEDIGELVGLLQEYKALEAAIKDADLAIEEVLKADEEAAVAIVGKVFEVINAIKDARN